MKRNKSGRHAGFTLIEVLIALAVVAIAVAAVQGGLAQAIDTTTELQNRSFALWVAQNRLTMHQLEQDWPPVGTREDDAEMGGIAWIVEEKIISTEIPLVRKVEIRVRQKNSTHVKAFLVGLVTQPQLASTGIQGP